MSYNYYIINVDFSAKRYNVFQDSHGWDPKSMVL